MGRRKQARPPPLQGAVHVRGHGRGAETFTRGNVSSLVGPRGQHPRKSTIWIAEALNEATTAYFTSFAISKTGVPSKQREWAHALRIAADTCLRMLAPHVPDAERPRIADHRVHSALFHWGEPKNIERAAGPAADFGYDPVRDALDSIPGQLWDLRQMAEHAEQRWRLATTPREKRRNADKAILSWVSHLADIYERVFGAAFPNLPKPTSPFVRFADAARRIALTATVTEHGTDDDARLRLEKLTPARLASFAREHRPELSERLARARKADYVPVRIELGIVADTD